FQAEDGIRDFHVTGVQTCALPISRAAARPSASAAPRASVAVGGRMRLASHQAMPRKMKPNSIFTRSIHGPALGRKRAPTVPNTRSEERRVGKEWKEQRGKERKDT